MVDLPLASREPVEHTTILLGPSGAEEVVWTVHPGLPIPPSRVPSTGFAGDLRDKRVPAADAYAFGLRWAKIR